MKRRSFIPEAPGRLEGRALLSGAAGSLRGPVAYSGLGFGLTLGRVKADFEEYAGSGDLPWLKAGLQQLAVTIPFGQGDGLGEKINVILADMRRGLASGAPRPISAAYHGVVAALRDEVKARIADRSIVVR
jgi:hypothetical protein